MSRYTKTQVTQLSANEQAAINNINKNFEDIETAIRDTVSRSGSTPTHMTEDLDMNGKRIINLPAPKTDTDPVRRQDVVNDIALVQSLVNATTNAAAQTLKAAADVQEIIQDQNVGLVADDLALDENSKIRICGTNIDYITTVAGMKPDINTVVASKEDIEDVADNLYIVTQVANNKTNINTVASNISNVNTVAGVSTDVTTVAGVSSNVTTVAGNTTNINTCASNISAITGASTQASNAASSANAAATSAQQAAISAAGTKFKLFHHDWFDYQLNDMAWLRADTFSWQNGTVYSDAYDHLVADYNGGTSQTETVGSYTITYVLATDGHKITTDETNVSNIYNESGVAWYYILDTTNQRFKLPRENPAREELIQVIRAKGNGIAVGFTDGTNTGGLYRLQMTNVSGSATLLLDKGSYGSEVGQTATTDRTWGTGDITVGLTTDSTKSGIISNMKESTSVYKGKKYLYFYVGQFNQTATEQTAGLNASLFNGKLDLDLGNISNVSKETIIGWLEPDWSAGVDIVVPVQATPYVCPSDGIYCFCFMPASSQSNLFVNGVKTAVCMRNSSSNNANKASSSAVLQKNDSIYFDVGTTTANTFASTFYPLKGLTNA